MIRTRMVLAAATVLAGFTAAQAGPSEALAFAIGQCSSQPDDKSRLLCYDMIAAQLRAGQQISATPQPFVQLPSQAPAAVPAQPPVAQAAPQPAPVAQVPVTPPAQTAMATPQTQNFGAPAPQRDSGSTWYDPTSWFGKDNPQRQSSNPADFGAEAIRNPATSPDQPKALDEMRSGVTKVEYLPNGRFIVTLSNGQMWRQLDGDTGEARFKTKGGDVVTISRGLLGSYNLVVEGRAMLFKVRRLK